MKSCVIRRGSLDELPTVSLRTRAKEPQTKPG